MMAAPGMLGAAVIVMPSIRINRKTLMKLTSIPCINIRAMAQLVIISMQPERCMLAHNGTTKFAVSSLTPFFKVCLIVTGIVFSEDEVLNAVKYAGLMLIIILKGSFLAIIPAMQNCIRSRNSVITKIIIAAMRNEDNSCPTFLFAARFINNPMMKNGSNGMIMNLIVNEMMLSNSSKHLRKVVAFVLQIPMPIKIEATSAVITPITGRMFILIYGSYLIPKVLRVSDNEVSMT